MTTVFALVARSVIMDARNKYGHDRFWGEVIMKRLQGEETVDFVYVLSSRKHGTLYIGVTGDLC